MDYVLDLSPKRVKMMWDSFPADDKATSTYEAFAREVEDMVKYLQDYDYEDKQLSFTFFELQDAVTGTILKDKQLVVVAGEKQPHEIVLTTAEGEKVHLFR